MSTKLPPIQPVSSPVLLALHGMPLLRLGFRPFYIGAAMLAASIVPLWVAIYLGGMTWLPTPVPLLWHAHEMLFGFAIAVIVGFLMTAGKAWTGLPTPRGPALGALVLLWLAARVAALVAPYPVFAVLDPPFANRLFVDAQFEHPKAKRLRAEHDPCQRLRLWRCT